MVLALDLDETLLHCTPMRNRKDRPDAQMELYVSGKLRRYQVYRRPHLDIFLYTASMLFEIVIFTASEKTYVCRMNHAPFVN